MLKSEVVPPRCESISSEDAEPAPAEKPPVIVISSSDEESGADFNDDDGWGPNDSPEPEGQDRASSLAEDDEEGGPGDESSGIRTSETDRMDLDEDNERTNAQTKDAQHPGCQVDEGTSGNHVAPVSPGLSPSKR